MTDPILAHSVVVAAPDQISSDLAGETVVLNAREGAYFSLHDVGARVWDLVQQPRRVSDIRETIISEYDVDETRWEHDLGRFLGQLAEAGLIEVRNDSVR